jgi:hypothetical protein
VARIAVAIRYAEDVVATWVDRYMASFWDVGDDLTGRPDAEVTAIVDRPARIRLSLLASRSGDVGDGPGGGPYGAAERIRMYMGAAGTRLSDGKRVLAVSEEAGLAFVREGNRVTVVADEAQALGLATVRVVRALAGALLELRGFVLVHAAGATKDGVGVLALGPKGAGKTTAVLSLATQLGWAVCAHDRCYLGMLDGELCALPWPSSLNVGVGLVAALGWDEPLRARYRRGERPPYHQAGDVTAAVLAGSHAPVRGNRGELKVQLLPSQVTAWFGVPLARRARIAALARPRLRPAGQAGTEPAPPAAFTARDVFPVAGETDSYPDFLRLSPLPPADLARRALGRLHDLTRRTPVYRVRLSHDPGANAAALARLGRPDARAARRPHE